MSVREFENPEESLGGVSAELFARVLGKVADIALVLDAAGKVRDVAFGGSGLADAGLGAPVGRMLVDLVTSESRAKVESLLDGGGASGRWRHVNWPVTGGEDVPIGLQMFGLGRGRMLAVGRDERQAAVVQRRFIAAQRELEQAHARLQQADLRFQTMLALSGLAVVTLDGETLRVLDANAPARDRLAGAEPGQFFPALLARDSADAARTALAAVAATGRAAAFDAAARDGPLLHLEAALFRYEQASRLLLRIVEEPRASAAPDGALLFARLPHAMAITAPDLRILQVNRAFVDLAQLSVEENALGQSIERFIGRHGLDTGIIAAALREQGSVRGFATVLVGAFGAVTEVDVDAVRLDGADEPVFGFFLRTTGQERRARPLDARDRAGLAEQVTDVVGRVALKDIVRDTTSVIERLCIETALGMTDNNRAAAADMLGISRQSLYAKLSRFGMLGPADPDE